MSLSLQAPAKLNRYLGILGRRADGFHELELVTTVLEGVEELADTLQGEPAESLSLALSGPTARGLSVDESNLVIQAWRLLEQEARKPLPAALRLEKRIPQGGGLGGGSSDAAAALKLGNRIFELGISQTRLLHLAARLGSDVPLFILGGTVLGLGRGERVFPLKAVPLEPILVVHPGLHVGTPSVYGALSAVGYPLPQALPSLANGEAPPWRNDLTGAAIFVCPLLAEVRQELLASGGEPLLCGSGSCWAARYETQAKRDSAAGALRQAHPSWGIWTL
ncbi:MAG: 4-(cytidine 5'-diphospho)-2-C-methyl-D-erythritol kinase [Acidobacteriota bacterium]|nr:4-(cytidine 5'-diphospho)-2-C-methyl-D-erythritol kinase [Acidobacteriota bacterium]